MSFWTHIVGVLHVDTFHCCDDIQKYVEEALKGAPQITGSERPADVFVNVQSGHNISTSFDCNRCEFKDTIIHFEEGGMSCDAPDGYSCPYGAYQTRVVITVQGDLRDRMKQITKNEWKKFRRYIEKDLKWTVRIATCQIDGI